MVTEKRLKKNHPIRMKIANVTLKMVKSFFFLSCQIFYDNIASQAL